MKKKVKKNSPKGKQIGEVTSFPYELSISMIVKNDVKRLRTFLKTLEVLRAAIPCQLIITDTGSVDGSREVAEEYADILLDFSWCDDFSKARNYGIEFAEGRWFAFFDSDHELDESVLSIVDFLKSPESYQADNVVVAIRDYTGNMDNLKYSHHWKALFFNFGSGKRYFEGRVHESIMVYLELAVEIPMTVKHWGYVGEKSTEKKMRNLPLLLQAIQESPLELKNYIQITSKLSNEPEVCKQYIEKGMEVAKKLIAMGSVQHLEQGILMNLQLSLAKVGDKLEDKALKAEAMAEAKGQFSGTILELEYLGLELMDWLKTDKVEETFHCFTRFKNLFFALKENPDLYYVNTGHFFATDASYYPVQEYRTLVYALQHDAKELFQPVITTASAYEFQGQNGEYLYLTKFSELAKQLKSTTLIHNMYEYFQKHGSEEEKEKIFRELQYCFLHFSHAEYFSLLEAFSHISPNALWAPYLCENVARDFVNLPTTFTRYFDPSPSHMVHYKVLLLHYMKTGEDSFGYIKNTPLSMLLEQFDLYWKQYPQPQNLLFEMFSNTSLRFPSRKEKKLCGLIGLRGLHFLCEENAPEREEMKTLSQGASRVLAAYVEGVYQSAILESSEDLIPREELFAYHCHQAWEAEGDALQFVRAWKAALSACPDYKDIVTFAIGLSHG